MIVTLVCLAALHVLDPVFDQQVFGPRQLGLAGKGPYLHSMPGFIIDDGGFDGRLQTQESQLGFEAIGFAGALERSNLQYRLIDNFLVDTRIFDRITIFLRNWDLDFAFR